MIVGVPVMDLHDVTGAFVESLVRTVTGSFRLVVVDNASRKPYRKGEFGRRLPFRVDVLRYDRNAGYYRPLLDLWAKFPDALVGLAHNDLVFYERGWDERMGACFARDPKLGLVGLCGSYEIDENGGRGGGTMCYFRGDTPHPVLGVPGQSQAAGERITDLRPSLILDSLFMMFRAGAVPALQIDDDVPLCHFYDKLWPCRLIEHGWRVGTLGVEIDHWGGLTAIGNTRYAEDCRRWFAERGAQPANPELEMYLLAERRFLSEYRDAKRFFPCTIDAGWNIARR